MTRALCLLSVFAGLAAAQGTDKDVPLSKVERKNKAPVSKDVLKVKLPKPVETKLENGLTVMILEDHRLPVVSVQMVFQGAGALFDPADRAGLAQMTSAMMQEGTNSLSSRQVAEAIDNLGASLSFGSGFTVSEARMVASGLSENFEQWFGVAMQVLENANFPDGELQKLKQRQLTRLRQQRSQANFLANEIFRKAIYQKFPAAVITATPESIAAIQPDELKKWRDTRYVPQNSILAISGDVNAKTLIPKLAAATAQWKKTDFKFTVPVAPQPQSARRVFIVDRPGSVQTALLMGNLAINRLSPDFETYTVINRLLGGGAGSRLFMNLREEKSYTYGAYSAFSPADIVGPWFATSEVRTAVTDGAMTEFLKEFSRIRDEAVPVSELQEAERSIIAEFALSLERPAEVLSYEVARKRFGLPEDYWDTYPARIFAVSAEDVTRVARKYIVPGNLQVVAVGDAAKIKTIMEKYGPVSLYSSDGQPIPQ